jgi:hypothetical protein
MTGLALQFNEITFRTVPSPPCPVHGYSVPTCFERLSLGKSRALSHMLSWARSLATPTISAELERHPGNVKLQALAANTADGWREKYMRRGSLPDAYAVEYLGNYTQYQDLVDLMSDHPDFKILTAKGCCSQLRDTLLPDYLEDNLVGIEPSKKVKGMVYRYGRPMYTEESQIEILE